MKRRGKGGALSSERLASIKARAEAFWASRGVKIKVVGKMGAATAYRAIYEGVRQGTIKEGYGVDHLQQALGEPNDFKDVVAKVLVAYQDNKPVAALSYQLDEALQAVHVGVLGSLQVVKGAACALQIELCWLAWEHKYWIYSEYGTLGGRVAKRFHKSIGRTLGDKAVSKLTNTSLRSSYWTQGEVGRIGRLKVSGRVHK